MLGGLTRFVARRSLILWMLSCFGLMTVAYVIADWDAETTAWTKLTSMGVPVWAIIAAYIVSWFTNGKFLGSSFLVCAGAWWAWDSATKAAKKNP